MQFGVQVFDTRFGKEPRAGLTMLIEQRRTCGIFCVVEILLHKSFCSHTMFAEQRHNRWQVYAWLKFLQHEKNPMTKFKALSKLLTASLTLAILAPWRQHLRVTVELQTRNEIKRNLRKCTSKNIGHAQRWITQLCFFHATNGESQDAASCHECPMAKVSDPVAIAFMSQVQRAGGGHTSYFENVTSEQASPVGLWQRIPNPLLTANRDPWQKLLYHQFYIVFWQERYSDAIGAIGRWRISNITWQGYPGIPRRLKLTSNSASKITVDFFGYSKHARASMSSLQETADIWVPYELSRTPPRPHAQSLQSGLKLASVKRCSRLSHGVTSRGLEATRQSLKTWGNVISLHQPLDH